MPEVNLLLVPSGGKCGSAAAGAAWIWLNTAGAAPGSGDVHDDVEVALDEFRHVDLRGLRDVQLVVPGGKGGLPQRDMHVDIRLAARPGRGRADELDLRAGRDVQADLGQRRLRVLGQALREVLARPGRDKGP